MKNLKSSALTDSQTDTLEKAYQDSKTRITLLTGFVTADRNAIKELIPSTAMTATQEEAFLLSIVSFQGTEDQLRNTVNSGLPSNVSIQADVFTIASRLRQTNNELGQREWFVSATAPVAGSPASYGYIRSGLCTTSSPSDYNIYTAGTVAPQFATTTATPTFVAKTDSCGTGVNAAVLTEYKCTEREYRSTASFSRTTTCPHGCKLGACLKGKIEPGTVTSDATGNTILSRITDGQKFYLKVNAARATDTTDPLTITLSSPQLTGTSPKCTLTDTADTTPTVKEFTTANQVIIFGEVSCTGATSTTFTFSLKDGTTEISTATNTITFGNNAMQGLIVTPPTGTIQGGTPAVFTIKAMGQNGLPFTTFNSPVILIASPTLEATAYSPDSVIIGTATSPASEKTISVTFPTSTNSITYTLFARGSTFTSPSVTVTVPGTSTTTGTTTGSSTTSSTTTGTTGTTTTDTGTTTSGSS